MNRARRFRPRKKGTERKPSAGAKRLALPWFKRRIQTGNRRLHGWNERCAALSVSKERNRQKKGTERKLSAGAKRLALPRFKRRIQTGNRRLHGWNEPSAALSVSKERNRKKTVCVSKRLALPWFKRRFHTGNRRLHGWNERCAALSVSKKGIVKRKEPKKTSAGPKRFSICAFHTKTVSPERHLRAAPRRAAATVG